MGAYTGLLRLIDQFHTFQLILLSIIEKIFDIIKIENYEIHVKSYHQTWASNNGAL